MPCKLGMSSVSLGRSSAGHQFIHKITIAQQYGYQGIELFHKDLIGVATQLPGGLTKINELEAAHIISQWCRERQLSIISLQPFWNYEGLLDRTQHDAHIERLLLWFSLAQALGTDLIQIPSNFLPANHLSNDPENAITDLREAADLGLSQQPAIRFMYEALAWGTHCDTWEQSWEIVQRVNRPNFGLCLDTFNIAARVWANPASPTGCERDADRRLYESLKRMVHTIDSNKLYCVQVVDAEKLASPLVQGHDLYDILQPARLSWSRNCRLFYGEKSLGGFLPIDRIAKAIFQGLQFNGWVSMELFHRRMSDADPNVPYELAARGATSWKKLLSDMNMDIAAYNVEVLGLQ